MNTKGLSRYDCHCLWAHRAIARDISCARRMAVSCPRACRTRSIPELVPNFYNLFWWLFFNVGLIPALHSDSVWNALRPLWINYVTLSFDSWENPFKVDSSGRDFEGIFPWVWTWWDFSRISVFIHLKTCPKTRLFMSHSIGQSKELEFALAPSSVVIMEATGSKFSTIITYLCLLILIVCNIISTSILNRVRWKQALNIYFEFT